MTHIFLAHNLLSGPLSILLSTGASHAIKLSNADALFLTTAMTPTSTEPNNRMA